MTVDSPAARPLIPVVLSGGSGTRLWPLSRELQPKQFLPLLGATSLFQETLLRAQALGSAVQAPIVVCNEDHCDWVVAQSRSIGVEPQAILLEPAGRNTAPAVAAAALLALQVAVDPLLLVLPADHVVTDTEAFAAAVRTASSAANAGKLVTFGVVPDKPETGYGYIRCGEQQGPWSTLGAFVEKPDLATAESYVRSGRYFWNSGMFLFTAGALLTELREHAADILTACETTIASAVANGRIIRFGASFLDCAANSIDYAVMEKTARGAVVPLAAGWSDVGSWSALHDVLPRDGQGNVAVGDVLLESCANSYVMANGRFVAAIGLEDIVVVETDDAVLVMRGDKGQDVKKVVDTLRAAHRAELLIGRKPPKA